MSARPIWLDGPGGPVFGWLHEPSETEASATAVVLVPPFGWEEECSYRSRGIWAERLAAAGHPTLRIDLPGAGDSAGSPTDPDLLDRWTAAVAAAAGRLRSLDGVGRVAGVGMGLGGLVAWRAAATGAAIDDLALWGAPPHGRAVLRELRAFARLNGSAASPPGTLPDGALEAGGFVVAPEMAQALTELDPATLGLPEAGRRRVLLLGRDSPAVPGALREVLEGAGADVDVAAGRGYGAMTAPPHEAQPAEDVFTAVAEWLSGDPIAAAAPGRPAAPERSSCELVVDGAAVRERAFTLSQPFGELFGVLAEPAERNPTGLCLVLLNAGAIRRTGPNRMWVEVARRWAARGVSSLRLDLEGIGDSEGDGSRCASMAELYSPGRVAQVRAALGALERSGVADRFVALGLCSGAYWAFHAALEDERVQGAVLLNPRALVWDPWLDPVRDARRSARVLEPTAWRRVARGQVRAARVRRVAAAALLAPLRRRQADAAARARGAEVDRLLGRLAGSGKPALLVFGEDEPLRDELEAEGRLARFADWPNVELELMPGDDHTMRPVASQRRAHELIDGAIARVLAAAAERRSAA